VQHSVVEKKGTTVAYDIIHISIQATIWHTR